MNPNDFVKSVKASLLDCGLSFEEIRNSGSSLGLGISGGADSVSLFCALKEILREEKIPLVCVTVNHHIREASETDRDMNFVKNLCEKAASEGYEVSLDVYDLKENQVQKKLEERGGGLEDAARSVRYGCFEESVRNHNISYFCLAHNLDDNLETMLMRFLKGSSSGGIEKVRGVYVRPLLEIKRIDIEEYLKVIGQNFCTDSTNLSDEYYRNRIRHKLVPFLNEEFPSWDKALVSGDEKRRQDRQLLDEMSSTENLDADLFAPGKEALSSRVLVREMNRAGVTERIPSEFINDLTREIRKALASDSSFSKRFSCCEAGVFGRKVFVKTYEKKQTDSGFFAIIEKDGDYLFPFGKISVRKVTDTRIEIISDEKSVTKEVCFPFVIRSPAPGEKKQLFVIEG